MISPGRRAGRPVHRIIPDAFASLIFLGALSMPPSQAGASALQYDIVVNGGSFSAPAAAIAAARTNPAARVLLVEPTDWLGGQATAQGVSAIDNSWHSPGGALMRDNQALYYPADYRDFLNRIRNKPAQAPGEGMAPNGSAWVSREAFDPRTGAWVLDEMTSALPNLTVLKMTVVKSVQTADATDEFGAASAITSLTLLQRTPLNGYIPHTKLLSQELADWYSTSDSPDFAKTLHTVDARDPAKGLVVIDASEMADVIVLSGAAYTVGREKTTEELAEDGSLPQMDELGSQATVFPHCMTDAATPDPETGLKAPWPDFDAYYASQSATYFSFGSHTWRSIWTYRRLKCAGTPSSTAVYAGDISMQNWYPGNDYPYGSIYLDKASASAQTANWQGAMNLTHIAQAEKHAVAWYFYMKDHRDPTVTWDTRYPQGWADPRNMMATGSGLAKFPYIRCCRRIIGLDNFRLTGRYFANTQASGYTGGTSWRFFDSVGIGNYAVDIHPTRTSTGMSPAFTYAAPFYVPYRALGSANVRNLLAAGKQLATTYVTNAAYRLHPIEWVIGSASGTAAGLMNRDSRTNLGMLDTAPLRELQEAVNQNSPISWAAFDTTATAPNNGDLIVNDLRPEQTGVPFRVEVYHHRAVRARIYSLGLYLGETTTRANGRLVLNNATAPGGSTFFTAYCYDGAGNLLDILQIPAGIDLNIVDNADPRFTTEGSWIVGTAQPNKYMGSYAYSWGSDQPSTATWSLTIGQPGLHEVAVWYPQSSNRALDAPFTVHHADGTTTVRLNQRVNGGIWFPLGQFRFAGAGGEKVTLSNDVADTSTLVVGDAVRISAVSADVADWPKY
jgi:hypothetical protein